MVTYTDHFCNDPQIILHVFFVLCVCVCVVSTHLYCVMLFIGSTFVSSAFGCCPSCSMLFGEDTEIQPVDTVLRDFGDEEEREVLID